MLAAVLIVSSLLVDPGCYPLGGSYGDGLTVVVGPEVKNPQTGDTTTSVTLTGTIRGVPIKSVAIDMPTGLVANGAFPVAPMDEFILPGWWPYGILRLPVPWNELTDGCPTDDTAGWIDLRDDPMGPNKGGVIIKG